MNRFTKFKIVLPKFLRRRDRGEHSETAGETEGRNLLFYLVVLAIFFLILFMLFKIFSKKAKPPQVSAPPPAVQQLSSATPEAKPATGSAKQETANKKCCKSLFGEDVGVPTGEDCVTLASESIDNLVNVVRDSTGLVLSGDAKSKEINGYVSSAFGNNNRGKFVVFLYQQDALNYEYDPPLRYKATSCTTELKEKLEKVLNPG